jgi:GNAT superfamily N-acetyltransferase
MAVTGTDLSLRPAAAGDAALVADLATARRPDWPQDPVLMAWDWAHPDAGWRLARYVAELSDEPVGYAEWRRPDWSLDPERWGLIDAFLIPAAITRERLAGLFETCCRELAEEGARKAALQVFEDVEVESEAALAAGFRRERVERAWELDLVAQRESLLAQAEQARARMRGQRIQLLTLAADRDPNKMTKLYQLAKATWQDIPHTVSIIDEPYADWAKWFERPGWRTDRYWIARDGDRIVALSFILYPPVRGVPETGYTGVDSAYRGRGIAAAVKLETLAQAIELGATAVRTDNDGQNAPILHINESLGYRPIPGWLEFAKDLRYTTRADRQRLKP